MRFNTHYIILLSVIFLLVGCRQTSPLEIHCRQGNSQETFQELEQSKFTQQISNGSFNPGYTNSYWWLKASIFNNTKNPAVQYILLNNPQINRITVLEKTDQASMLLGDKLPFHKRPVNLSDFAIPITLNPQESKTIFIGIDKIGESLQLKAELTDEKGLRELSNMQLLTAGIISGWMLLIIFIVIIIWYYTKEQANIHYVLYIGSITLWILSNFGIGFQLLWPSLPGFNNISRPFFLFLAQYFFAQAMLNYFGKKSGNINLRKIIELLSWLAILMALTLIFTDIENISIQYKTQFLLLLSISIGSFVLLSFLYIHSNWKASVKFSSFYFYGMLFFLFISLCQNIFQFGISNPILEFLNIHGASMSILGETSIIAIGFIYKFNEFKKEKETIQAELLAQQFAVSKEIINIQEQERRRIGQDIHDSIGGLLATMKIYLEKAAITTTPPYNRLEDCLRILDQCMHEIRIVIDNLVPQNIHLHGFCKAFELHIAHFSETTNSKTIFYHEVHSEITISSQTVIYRVLTELFNNCTKHAQATEINISIIEEEKNIRILFEDNGIGFNTHQVSKGHGLKNIANRIKFLNGKIHLDSNHQGTTTIIHIPVYLHLVSPTTT